MDCSRAGRSTDNCFGPSVSHRQDSSYGDVKPSCMKEQVNTWFLVETSTRASADGANGRTGADGLHHGVKEIGSKEIFRCFNSDHWAVFHCLF